MIVNKFLSVMTTVLLVSWLAGCEYIQEPWISNEDDLKQQRQRTALESDQLSDRLIYTQIDR